MAHRIRYAMEQPPLREKPTGIIEADECSIGGRRHGGPVRKPGPESHKAPVVALVQRGGAVRSFQTAASRPRISAKCSATMSKPKRG